MLRGKQIISYYLSRLSSLAVNSQQIYDRISKYMWRILPEISYPTFTISRGSFTEQFAKNGPTKCFCTWDVWKVMWFIGLHIIIMKWKLYDFGLMWMQHCQPLNYVLHYPSLSLLRYFLFMDHINITHSPMQTMVNSKQVNYRVL